MLVGHGSYDGEAYKLNLPGPDIDSEEFAKLLSAVPARSQLVVNATSASGAVLEKWAAEGRTLITATRSGFERNATRFAQHFAAALAAGSADINKNGAITAQEAFDYASRSVADSFEKDGALATEHPQIAGGAAGRFTVARLASAGPAVEPSADESRPSRPSSRSARGSTPRSRTCAGAANRWRARRTSPSCRSCSCSSPRCRRRSTPRSRGRSNDVASVARRARGPRAV